MPMASTPEKFPFKFNATPVKAPSQFDSPNKSVITCDNGESQYDL